MDMLKTILDLYRHMEWADAAVWSAVLASEHGRTDETLRKVFFHSHVTQRAFLRTWRGEARDAPYPTFDALPPLLAWARTYYGEALAYLVHLSDEALSRPMPLSWAAHVTERLGRSPVVTSMQDTVLQVVMHTAHHRGQINARLRAVGGEPPLVDYIAWVWFDRPAAVWPEHPS